MIQCDISVKDNHAMLSRFRDWAVVIRCPVPECMAFTNGKLPVYSAVCPFPSSSAFQLSQRTFASLISDQAEAMRTLSV